MTISNVYLDYCFYSKSTKKKNKNGNRKNECTHLSFEMNDEVLLFEYIFNQYTICKCLCVTGKIETETKTKIEIITTKFERKKKQIVTQ